MNNLDLIPMKCISSIFCKKKLNRFKNDCHMCDIEQAKKYKYVKLRDMTHLFNFYI